MQTLADGQPASGDKPRAAEAPKGPLAERLELRTQALAVLRETEPARKAIRTLALAEAWSAGQLRLEPEPVLTDPGGLPGRPARPRLIDPRHLPQRSPFTREGLAALVHAVAHIEFNAINLGLDAVWRFAGMPADYYRDWLGVAADEARHFSMLQDHLRTSLGRAYGDFDAHDGLWTMAQQTAHDPIARMALVPRLLEARGLDATPPMQARLARAGDAQAVSILEVILRDEVGHVAVGNRWYRWLCARAGLDPVAHDAHLMQSYGAPRPRGPFNLDARRRAGFTAAELANLPIG